MRIRFNNRIDLCTEVVRQDGDVFFGLHSGEVYIVSFVNVGSAEHMLNRVMEDGYIDLSEFRVMDKNWNYI